MANKIGPLIKQARTDAGFTQEQLAKKVDDLSASELSKAERGELELSQNVLKQIAKATGVTQKSLLEAAAASTYKAASKTSSEKKSSSKTTEKSSSKTSSSAATSSMKVTAAEKKLVELYRAADSAAKKNAVKILKGEALEEDEVSGLLPTLLAGKGKEEAISALLKGLSGSGSSSKKEDDMLSSLLSGFMKK